jgi:pyruvate/2-oxoglutarate dehydrogenase complex dihydrolipoamide acyltransferase (E2) component
VSETLIRMPKLADTLVDGTVGHWLKQVGDQVSAGEPLATIETDKVTTELTSSASGSVLEHLVAEGQTVAIDTPIARIGDPTEPPAAPKATPVAARLLAEHGLRASDVASRAQRLTKDDVLAHLAAKAAPPLPPGELMPLTSMRRAIAEHMTLAYQSIRHGQTVMAADLSDLVTWREANKQSFQRAESAPLTLTVFFVHALGRALAQRGQTAVHLGVAVALDGGLIVPVLRDADSLSLPQTARGIADLANRARSGKLALDETQGATMTVTNVGSFGNLTASPIIPVGQTAILGPGLVEQRPLPTAQGGIRPGWQCLLALMFDRRTLDDFAADRLLRSVVQELTAIPHFV